MQDKPLAASNSPRIYDTAKAQVAATTAQAQNVADQKIAAARDKATALLLDAHEQAHLITGAVHDYYFNYQKSVSVWTPSGLTRRPTPIKADSWPVSDIEFDENSGHVLWASEQLNAIMYANSDGSNANTLYNCSKPKTIATDPKSGNIYWVSGSTKIMQGNIGRFTPSPFLTLPKGLYSNVVPLKIDAARDANDKLVLFWADGSAIYRASGSDDIKPIFCLSTSSPVYIALDKVNLLVYWLDQKLNAVCSCDFDGANFNMVFSLPCIQGTRGLRVEPSNGDIYFIHRMDSGPYNLKRFNPKGQSAEGIETLYQIGPLDLNWGLALRLTATGIKLRAALQENRQAQISTQLSIQSARNNGNTTIQNAQLDVTNAQNSATKALGAARQNAEKIVNAAFQQRDQEQVANQGRIAEHAAVNERDIARTREEAQAHINQKKKEADEAVQEEKAKLDAAQAALSNLGR